MAECPFTDPEISPAISVLKVVSDCFGQVQSLQPPLLYCTATNLLSDHSPAEIHKWQWFRLQPTQVFHCDLAVAPHSRDYRVNLLSTESAMCHTKKLSFNTEGEGALLHIKHNWKCHHDQSYDDVPDKGVDLQDCSHVPKSSKICNILACAKVCWYFAKLRMRWYFDQGLRLFDNSLRNLSGTTKVSSEARFRG